VCKEKCPKCGKDGIKSDEYRKYIEKDNQGQTLIEAIVATGIMIMGITAVLSLAIATLAGAVDVATTPAATGGANATSQLTVEDMQERIKGMAFHGRPVESVSPAGLGTDGPFTAAANVRGATELCTDIYEDREYAVRLLDYITEATIKRIKAWPKMLGQDMRPQNWGFADDSIALLSTNMYRELVLPFHKRLISELAGSGRSRISLAGSQRTFKGVDECAPARRRPANRHPLIECCYT
jgi:hypothetical protein